MAKTRDYMDYLDENIEIAPANSQEEYQAAETIAGVMRDHGLEANIEEFDARPWGELLPAVIRILVLVFLVATNLTEGPVRVATLLLAVAGVGLLLLSHFAYNVFEGLGPAARSQNVVAVHRAEGSKVIKGARPIVIVVHYDTPRQSLLRKGPLASIMTRLRRAGVPCTIVVGVVLVVQAMTFLPGVIRTFMWVIGIIAALPLLFLAIAAIYDRYAPCTLGANDNKSSVAAMLSILAKVRPADDRVNDEDRSSRQRAADRAAQRAVEVKPRRIEVVEEVHGVRHGADVLAMLGILPQTCEVIYEEPKVQVIEETPEDTYAAAPAEDEEQFETDSDSDETDELEEYDEYDEEFDEDRDDESYDKDDADSESDDGETSEEDESPATAPFAPQTRASFSSSSKRSRRKTARKAEIEDDYEYDESDEEYEDYDEEEYDEDYDEEYDYEEDYDDESSESAALAGIGAWFAERVASIREYFSSRRGEDVDIEYGEDRTAGEDDAEDEADEYDAEDYDADEYEEYYDEDSDDEDSDDEESDDAGREVFEEEDTDDESEDSYDETELDTEDAYAEDAEADEYGEEEEYTEGYYDEEYAEEDYTEECDADDEADGEYGSEDDKSTAAVIPFSVLGEDLEWEDFEDEEYSDAYYEEELEEEPGSSDVDLEKSEDAAVDEIEEAPEEPSVKDDYNEWFDDDADVEEDDVLEEDLATDEEDASAEHVTFGDRVRGFLQRLRGDDSDFYDEEAPDEYTESEYEEDDYEEAWPDEEELGETIVEMQDIESAEDEEVYLAEEYDDEYEDEEYSLEDEADESSEVEGVELVERPSDPNKLHFDREEDSDIVPRDPTGLDMISYSYDLYSETDAPQDVVYEKPAPIEDSNWGVSTYQPARPALNIARRAALFDLPDPSASYIDPLQDDEDYDDYEAEPYGAGAQAESDSKVQEPHVPEVTDESERSGFWGDASSHGASGWKGGATVRSDLRAGDGEDDPIVIDADDLQDAILEMGDEYLIAHDIWFVATGASTIDHAGIKAFLDEHRRDIRGSFLVNLESIGAGSLSVLVREGMRAPRRADRRLVRMLTTIAEDLHIPMDTAIYNWDECDSASAMRARVRSVSVMGMDDNNLPAYSHTNDDVPDNVDPKQVSSVVRLVTELIRRS